MVKKALNNITNKLLQEYDLNFNKNYNNIVQLNSEIQNKEQLIIKTEELTLFKERYIIILQYFIYYLLSLIILGLFYVLKIIKSKEFLFLALFLFFIFTYLCYQHIKNYFNLYTIKTKINALKINMKDYAKKLLENNIQGYKCPSKCENKPNDDINPETDTDSEFIDNLDDNQLLKIDPSLNVWKYGDVPINDNLDSMEEIMSESNPKSNFGTSYPKSTYYECKWLGSNTNKGMPLNLKENLSTYSTIPCNYKPNTTEIARYICNNDPNENGIEECQKI